MFFHSGPDGPLPIGVSTLDNRYIGDAQLYSAMEFSIDCESTFYVPRATPCVQRVRRITYERSIHINKKRSITPAKAEHRHARVLGLIRPPKSHGNTVSIAQWSVDVAVDCAAVYWSPNQSQLTGDVKHSSKLLVEVTLTVTLTSSPQRLAVCDSATTDKEVVSVW